MPEIIRKILDWLARLRGPVPNEPITTIDPDPITMSNEGLLVLRNFEGLRLKAYRDPVGVALTGRCT